MSSSSQTLARKGKAGRTLLAGLALLLLVAFGGLKLYERHLASQMHEGIITAFPSVKTEIKVDILGRKVVGRNTEFTFEDLLPGFSPQYAIKEIILDDLEFTALLKGSLERVNRLTMKGLRLITPLATAEVDEFVQEGLSGDLETLGMLIQKDAPLPAILEVAKTLHVDRYYAKNYKTTTPPMVGNMNIHMDELELTDVTLERLGPIRVSGYVISQDGQEVTRLKQVTLESIEIANISKLFEPQVSTGPGDPAWAGQAPVGTLITLKGLLAEGYRDQNCEIAEYRLDFVYNFAQDLTVLQSQATGAVILPTGLKALGLDVILGPVESPVSLSWDVDAVLNPTSVEPGEGIDSGEWYSFNANSLKLEAENLFTVTGNHAKGLIRPGINTIALLQGDLVYTDAGLAGVLLKTATPPLHPAQAQEELKAMAETTEDQASRNFQENIIKLLSVPGALELKFSADKALSPLDLFQLFLKEGSRAKLESAFSEKR